MDVINFNESTDMNNDFVEEAVNYGAYHQQEQDKLDKKSPAERLVDLLREGISYCRAKTIMRDIAGDPELRWTGNEYHGWNKLVYLYHDSEIILSPYSGPGGEGDWYVVCRPLRKREN